MASKLKSVVDGWENWQIALAVGAPIALGLAGVWYYKRSKNSETAKTPTDKSSSPKNEVQIKVEKAQEAKTKGNKYFKGGRYDLAIECYTEAISICPENQPSDMSTFYQNRAAAYEQLKNHEKVIEDCSRALELHNRYIKAFFRRAKAYELTQQMEKALEDITAVCIMERFENQQSLVMADRVLKEVGKTKAKEAFKNRRPAMPSKQYIKSYFASFANDPVHRWQKTRPQTEQKSPTKAKPDKLGENEDENLNQSSTESDNETGTPQVENHVVNDTYEPSSFEKARDALLTGEYESIIPLCSEGATEGDNPDQALCFLLRATFYFLKGQGELARSDLTTLLTNNDLPKNIKVNALIKRGNLSMEESRQTEALDDLAAAVRVDSTNSDIYFHRGQQNLSMDRTDDALRDFEKCIQLNPAFSAAYVQKCYTEYRSALMNQNPLQLQSAVINFKQAIEKFPFYAEGHILYGQALSDQANFEEADAHFRKASEIQPDNAQSLVHRGLLCLQWKQDIQRAMDFIDQAIRVDDKCGLGYETLGTIEVQRGNMGRAMELFNRAIELCTSEAQMTHLFSLLHAATAQSKVAQGLGLNFPMAS